MPRLDASDKKAIKKITLWRQNLLDLSSRNPQLYFNPNQYIEILHPDMDTIVKVLVVLGQSMEFPSIFAGTTRKSKTKSKNSPDSEEEDNDINTNDKQDPNPSSPKKTTNLSPTHLDVIEKKKTQSRLNELITNQTDKKLQSKFKSFLQSATEAEEERGVNILFLAVGLMQWKERDSVNHSPLLFVPIQIKLKPLEISIIDDSLIENQALTEKLHQFRIDLPEFPEEFSSSTLFHYFEDVKSELPSDWNLEHRTFIGTFSFAKAALYRDLQNEAKILSHPITRAIAAEAGFEEEISNLPDPKELTDENSAESSFSILDCDSSQLEAIKYAKSGASLIIQGPPGTGKSQTISNIISECLAIGKKVLFVAQKQAALNVVKKRLVKAGIGDFILTLHSQNANKLEVLGQIETSLNLNPTLSPYDSSIFSEFHLLKDEINTYAEVLNQKTGLMQYSANDIYGILLSLKNIPLFESLNRDPMKISLQSYISLKSLFSQLNQFRPTLETYNDNPWILAKLTSTLILSPEFKTEVQYLLKTFSRSNKRLQDSLTQHLLKYPPHFQINLEQSSQWERMLNLSKYWIDVVFNLFDDWVILESTYNKLSDYFNLSDVFGWEKLDFNSLKQLSMAYQASKPSKSKVTSEQKENEQENENGYEKMIKGVKEHLLTLLHEYKLKIEHFNNRITVFNLKSRLKSLETDEDLFLVKEFFDKFKSKSLLLDSDGLLARFTIDYTSARKRISDQYKIDKEEILSCIRDADPKADVMGYLNIIKNFQDNFGRPYGANLDHLQDLLVEFYDLGKEWQDFRDLDEILHPLFSLKLIPVDFQQKFWDLNTIFCKQWLDNLPYLHDWFEVQIREHQIRDLGYEGLFNSLKNQKIGNISYTQVFEKVFFSKWLSNLIDAFPPLSNFDAALHNSKIEKFRQQDRHLFTLNQIRVLEHLIALRPKSDLESGSGILLTQSGFIKREMKKKRNILPLRKIFSQAKELISIYTPCFMMSPLSIANYLDLEDYFEYFDVVIFDEASQVTPEDGISAILRGKSLIVVGDSKQLPPTNFFTSKSVNEELEEVDQEIQNMESLLDECTGIGFREKMLKFHYRSKREQLIAFSNQNYYSGRLFTFPDIYFDSSTTDSSSSPNASQEHAIDFHWVQNGFKEKGKNEIEAQAVAKAIVDHYQFQYDHPTESKKSLGIIAFNIKQQETIQFELDKLLKSHLEIETLISAGSEPLFIKNLENVQGDERDVIFFSIGFAKDKKGSMSLNFGPLNRSGGYRRLNVAITRARIHVKIFASFLPSEIQLDKINAQGLMDLIHYMQFARGISILGQESQNLSHESVQKSVLDDIKQTLEAEGYELHTNIGSSSHKLDLAVLNPAKPGEYKLVIETDGGTYAHIPFARDRERIKNDVLSALGWKTYHVWTPKWFHQRQACLREIKNLLES